MIHIKPLKTKLARRQEDRQLREVNKADKERGFQPKLKSSSA
jgi:hypothetical protein